MSHGKQKNEPYVSATWLAKLISGDNQCWWATWFKANRWYQKLPRSFDLAGWTVEHNRLLDSLVTDYKERGYKATVEKQNSFKVIGTGGRILAGTPDLVVSNDKEAVIVDAKTGQQRTSDVIQMQIYMLVLPLTTQFSGWTFTGRVVYKDGRSTDIPPSAIDAPFRRSVKEGMDAICGTSEPARVPSFGECSFCEISSEYCPERVEKETAAANAEGLF